MEYWSNGEMGDGSKKELRDGGQEKMVYHSKSPQHSNSPPLQYSITVDPHPFYPIDADSTRRGLWSSQLTRIEWKLMHVKNEPQNVECRISNVEEVISKVLDETKYFSEIAQKQ
jgi:hypothetical protein